MADAEMAIKLASDADFELGAFVGVASIWMPYPFGAWVPFNRDFLSTFAMRFDWDQGDHALLNGELSGQRVLDDQARLDYTATFDGKMVEAGNRINGYWFNDERGKAGRFEMIRGTAGFTL